MSGVATIYLVKEVVKTVENENTEFTLKEAVKYKKNAKLGDEVRIDVTPADYGRIAAQSAKQVIIQRVQEAERDVMYETFKDRENELINALIHRVEDNNVYVSLDNKITTMLPYDQQIPGEKYYGGQRIKLYLDKVIKTTKGPQLLISRTHPNLVRKLLELEIPEVKSELVEIKGIAREPGVRCKISVSSSDEKIDPIGSCVGQKGVRVQNIMDELSGERIDIIKWSDNQEEYIKAALAPAKVAYIQLDEKHNNAKVYVYPDQRPLAIGKNGQNVRLASDLTVWEIDILDIGDLDGKTIEDEKLKAVKKVTIKQKRGKGYERKEKPRSSKNARTPYLAIFIIPLFFPSNLKCNLFSSILSSSPSKWSRSTQENLSPSCNASFCNSIENSSLCLEVFRTVKYRPDEISP